MTCDIQKAGLWKRIAAGMLDGILLAILAAGVAFLLGAFLGYDGYTTTWNESCAYYEEQYNTSFQISEEQYLALSPEEKENYENAYEALIQDEAAVKAYNMMRSMPLLIITGGILVACLLLEFALPMFFGNGQTVGKKVFGLGVVRVDSVRTTSLQMFVRTVLGKFTVEIMIPVYVVHMIIFNTTGLEIGTLLLGALLVAQILIMALSANNYLIHDLLAGTVAVDFSSQKIFADTEALIAYKKKAAAEVSARQAY